MGSVINHCQLPYHSGTSIWTILCIAKRPKIDGRQRPFHPDKNKGLCQNFEF